MAIEPTISGGSKVTTMSLQDSGTTYEVFGQEVELQGVMAHMLYHVRPSSVGDASVVPTS
jgi:hypothetical protein